MLFATESWISYLADTPSCGIFTLYREISVHNAGCGRLHQLAGAQLLLRVHWGLVRSSSLKYLYLFLFLFEQFDFMAAAQVWRWKTLLLAVHKEKFNYRSLDVSN